VDLVRIVRDVNSGLGAGMNLRPAVTTDREALFDVWWSSVRATHSFVREEDLRAMIPQVRQYFASESTDFWVLCDDAGAVVGFLGMSGSTIESLFLDPRVHRQGGGRRLVEHAQSLRGELTADVNEQNAAACCFYKACGFVVEGRSPVDDQGRSYPLLHLRWVAPDASVPTHQAFGPIGADEDSTTRDASQPLTGS
jgi:putative acetyltransferase